jgi:hypothetical protein
MKYILIILTLLFSGCAHRFYPVGDKGFQTPYYWADETCAICHKKHTFFKLMDKKRLICADCYEKKYR